MHFTPIYRLETTHFVRGQQGQPFVINLLILFMTQEDPLNPTPRNLKEVGYRHMSRVDGRDFRISLVPRV